MSAPEELVFRTEVQSGKSIKDTEKLTKSIKNTDKAVKDVGKTTQKTATDMKKGLNDVLKSSDSFEKKLATVNKIVKETPVSIRDMNKQIQAYQSIALEAGRTSPVGQEALAQAAALKDRYVDIQNETKRLADDQKNLKGVMEIGSGVVAGYGALQGAMALTGNVSEEMRETMVKLQAVQTILISLDKIRTSLQKESSAMLLLNTVRTKTAAAAQVAYTAVVGGTTGALKALRIAFLAIPIVAIIAGIMALISALTWFFSSAEEAEEQNKAVNKSFEEQNKLLEKNSEAYKRNADNKRALMEAEHATAQEMFEFDKKRIADEEKMRKDEVALLKETLPKKTAAYKQALEEGNNELAKTIREETATMREHYHDLLAEQGQWTVDTQLLEAKHSEAMQAEQDTLQNWKIKNIENADDRAIAQMKQKHAEELAELIKRYGEENAIVMEAKEQQAKQLEALEQKQRQARWQKYKKRREEEAAQLLEEQRLLEDLLAANIADADSRQFAQMQLAHERELQELKARYGAEHDIVIQAQIKQESEVAALKAQWAAKAKQEEDALAAEEEQKRLEELELQAVDERARLEGKLIKMREDWEATQALKRELAALEMEEALAQENLTEGEKFRIKQEYAQKIDTIRQEDADREKERQASVAQAAENVLAMGLESAQNLTDAFFGYKLEKAKGDEKETLKIEKKKFEVNKKLQIAQAVMQGIQAVMAAYSSGAAIPVVGAVTGPAFAVLAGVASALNIAKISATKFQGGGGARGATGGGASASTPSVAVPSIGGEAPDLTTLTQGLAGSGGSSSSMTKVTLLQSELEESLSESQSVDVVSNVG